MCQACRNTYPSARTREDITMKRPQWTPASVGCHWFRTDRNIAISTMAWRLDNGAEHSAYGVWVDCELVTDFPTLGAAQRFADQSFPAKA